MIKSYSKFAKNKAKIYYIFTAVTLVAIAGFLAVSNWRILGKTMDSIKYRQTAEVNLKNISDREEGLTFKLNELETDTGLDKEIRERFPVSKPGEEVIMIISGNTNDATSGNEVKLESFWNKLINFFKE